MADTVTPVLGLVKPEINGAQTENVWGFDLNANFDKLDAFAGATNVMIDAPSDSVIYGRLNGAWTPSVLKTDFDALTTTVAGKAPLASPVFTGNPTAPTAAPGDNDTSIATTAFVHATAIAAGAVFPGDTNPSAPGTAAPGVSTNYSRADHVHPAQASDTTKVAKAGDTMTGNLNINTGALALYGYGGAATSSIIVMNSTSTVYIHQTGALFNFVGLPVNIGSVVGSTLPSNGALTVAGGAGIAGALNVGGAFTGSGSGSFGNSIKLPDTTGIGWGNFPHTTGTPQFVYNSGLFQFSKVPGAAVLAMNPVSLASTFGGTVTLPATGAGVLNFGGQGSIYGNTSSLVLQTGLYNFYNQAGTLVHAQIDATSMRLYQGTPSSNSNTGALVVAGGVGIGGALSINGNVGFYGTLPIAKQTTVPATVSGLYNALYSLGLIDGADLLKDDSDEIDLLKAHIARLETRIEQLERSH